ncbi:MAG: IclR family transcriptional regulator [Hyphomicrobium sp.]|uniref:IclR family transcriptional regulator n=1 Tax=Hyphomicrobium sp. TaxID=82 RepID=UPI0039E5FB03
MGRDVHEVPAQREPRRPAKPKRVDGDLVQSLNRAIAILEILSEGGCRLKDVSTRANLPPSTTHRLLTTLEQKRLVRFDREENLWDIGSNCFAIGAGFLRRKHFMSIAVSRIECLAVQTGATVSLGVLESGSILLVKQAKRLQITPAVPPGSSLPVHATAMGKVLLASSSDPRISGSFSLGTLARLTDRTICDPSMLARELHTVRAGGIAIDDEESMMGRRCIAAPIHDELGDCVAAVSVTDTSSQLTNEAVQQLSAHVSAAAAEITRNSGGFLRRKTGF